HVPAGQRHLVHPPPGDRPLRCVHGPLRLRRPTPLHPTPHGPEPRPGPRPLPPRPRPHPSLATPKPPVGRRAGHRATPCPTARPRPTGTTHPARRMGGRNGPRPTTKEQHHPRDHDPRGDDGHHPRDRRPHLPGPGTQRTVEGHPHRPQRGRGQDRHPPHRGLGPHRPRTRMAPPGGRPAPEQTTHRHVPTRPRHLVPGQLPHRGIRGDRYRVRPEEPSRLRPGHRPPLLPVGRVPLPPQLRPHPRLAAGTPRPGPTHEQGGTSPTPARMSSGVHAPPQRRQHPYIGHGHPQIPRPQRHHGRRTHDRTVAPPPRRTTEDPRSVHLLQRPGRTHQEPHLPGTTHRVPTPTILGIGQRHRAGQARTRVVAARPGQFEEFTVPTRGTVEGRTDRHRSRLTRHTRPLRATGTLGNLTPGTPVQRKTSPGTNTAHHFHRILRTRRQRTVQTHVEGDPVPVAAAGTYPYRIHAQRGWCGCGGHPQPVVDRVVGLYARPARSLGNHVHRRVLDDLLVAGDPRQVALHGALGTVGQHQHQLPLFTLPVSA